MATVADFCANAWVLEKSVAGRRQLFYVGDVLTFSSGTATTAALSAVDAGGTVVLGRPIQLTLSAQGQLTATDYGRQMTFKIIPGTPAMLIYEAEYEAGPGPQPDESGEGDPK